jgi:pSer/pThr/pTyr-binding forkhead associated (FHA) protein
MAKLILKFEDRILKEVPLSSSAVTIGRLPNNVVAIDNPAVSGQHARVIVEGGQFVVEDLNSRNGTFVNNQAVTKHTLQEGDVIRIGKHTLTFYGIGKGEAIPDTAPAAAAPGAPVQDLGGTVFLDTKAQKELLAKAKAAAQAQAAAGSEPGAAAPAAAAPAAVPRAVAAAPTKVGVLTVVSGKTDQKQYKLETQTTLVGKSDTALIRLKGWFKPQVGAAITRKGSTYLITPLAGKSQVNGQPLRQGYELKPGDVLDISGVTFQFSQQE